MYITKQPMTEATDRPARPGRNLVAHLLPAAGPWLAAVASTCGGCEAALYVDASHRHFH